ncbi:uncharacterized protein LOC127757813 [Oryza glaberrima]|uniref:uncharacterized protein LOC127757813 n=1 Tax=Oryza glaberrima TaxID=4538 RepID=UPI00224BF41B|nr:uncharacterized protein LOC127757813 [Oryza glaberrima]
MPSLKILAVAVQFWIDNETMMLPRILECFPCLETLHILCRPSSSLWSADRESNGLKFWTSVCSNECLKYNLKTITLDGYDGSDQQGAFLDYIFRNAKVLKTVGIVGKNGTNSNVVKDYLPPLVDKENPETDNSINGVSICAASDIWSTMGRGTTGLALSDPFYTVGLDMAGWSSHQIKLISDIKRKLLLCTSSPAEQDGSIKDDLWGKLPSKIQLDIIGRLPLADFFRCGYVLSRAHWRWMDLSINDEDFKKDFSCVVASKAAILATKISTVLGAHHGNLSTVCITNIDFSEFVNTKHMGSCVNIWFKALHTKKAKHLILYSDQDLEREHFQLPTHLLSCNDLVSINIGAVAFPDTRGHRSAYMLESLRELELTWVTIATSDINMVLRCCKALERLFVIGHEAGRSSDAATRDGIIVQSGSLKALILWYCELSGLTILGASSNLERVVLLLNAEYAEVVVDRSTSVGVIGFLNLSYNRLIIDGIQIEVCVCVCAYFL